MDTPSKIGRYEIVEELGHGAMGAVYRAKDPAMGREVALKTILAVALSSQQSKEFRERFYREARAAGSLAHPGIVPIFDVGEHEGVPFLVMEFISGRTLDQLLKHGERLSIERACEIGQRIAEALGYAHQHGVVHRDIKPANILLTSRETYGIERPKIADFGVAKLTEGSTTMTGQLLGTPAFMPPEQFTGGPIDGRADLFSLGVVLYWMATGEQAFPGESITSVSYKVVHTEPIPPRKLNPWMPAEFEAVIMKCLAKSPDDRYQTGEELAQDLGRIRDSRTGVRRSQPSIEQTVVTVDPNAVTLVGVPGPVSQAAAAAQPALAPQPVQQSQPAPPPQTAPAPQPATAAQPTPATAVPAAPKKSGRGGLVAAVLVVVASLAVGGWYVMRLRTKSVIPPAPSSPAVPTTAAATKPAPPVEPAPASPNGPAPVTTASETPAASTIPQATPVVAPAKKVQPKSSPTAAAPASSPSATGKTDVKIVAKAISAAPSKAAPEPAAVDFDPKTLDSKTNARIKIDSKHMPAGLDFTIEMNGKRYLQATGAGSSTPDVELYVPPGVQEFRVTAKSGTVRKASNTVSAEFKAKKKLTLKIELRTPGSSGTPQGLYPDSQLVVALK